MGKTIGAAADFYRLRITRIDQSGEPDLEWRDDILYRTPPRDAVREEDAYAIEAVAVSGTDDVTVVAVYVTADEAREALASIEDDLGELTVAEFEARYLEPSK